MKYYRIPLFFILLGILTMGLMAWQHWGMQKTITILPNSEIKTEVISDTINGGVSKASLKQVDSSFDLHCTLIQNGYTHPFCGITFGFKNQLKHFNASKFEQMEVTLEVESTVKDTILVYLLNQENVADPNSAERANMRPINVHSGEQTYTIPLNSFFVPSWWVLLYPDDELRGAANLNNITSVRITSGDNTLSRTMRITTKAIKFHGKFIQQETLYLVIIIVWVSLVLYFSFSSLNHTRQQIKNEKRRSRELQSSNELLEREKNRLYTLSKTDPLTGALNRAGLEEAVSRFQNAHHYRGKTRCSLILLDIDYFKSINDTHGHDKGDNVLKELVELLKGVVRKTDLIIRLGGEEFLLLCQFTSYQEGLFLAEKCRQKIAKTQLSGLDITSSFGVTDCEPSNIPDALDVADQALYRAKNSGRNRVCGSQDNA